MLDKEYIIERVKGYIYGDEYDFDAFDFFLNRDGIIIETTKATRDGIVTVEGNTIGWDDLTRDDVFNLMLSIEYNL